MVNRSIKTNITNRHKTNLIMVSTTAYISNTTHFVTIVVVTFILIVVTASSYSTSINNLIQLVYVIDTSNIFYWNPYKIICRCLSSSSTSTSTSASTSSFSWSQVPMRRTRMHKCSITSTTLVLLCELFYNKTWCRWKIRNERSFWIEKTRLSFGSQKITR